MKLIQGFKNLSRLTKNSIVAVGNFDGIHLGHQKILRHLLRETQKQDARSLVLTFSPHPERILGKKKIKMIQTLEQRLREIEKFDVQNVLVIPFDHKFANLSSQEFIEKIV